MTDDTHKKKLSDAHCNEGCLFFLHYEICIWPVDILINILEEL